MAEFTEKEKELMTEVGLEAVKFLFNLYKTSRAKGVDLETLFDKAAENNSLNFDEV